MADKIMLCDLRRQYAPLRDEIMTALDEVFTGMQLNLGPNVRAFEQEWANFCGVKHAVGIDNGTDALMLAMHAYGIGKGDEVITPANTFIAVIEAIFEVGATPVIVDIEPLSYSIDVAAMEAAITPRTRAIVPVHLYGIAADMDAINAIAKPKGILVIEDASQAHGAKYKGKHVGGLGDAAAFSLYYTKNLGAYGEAGIFTTNDEAIAQKIDMLRQHGASPTSRYSSTLSGFNSRLDEVQAVILRIKLKRLAEWNAQRNHWAKRYTELLGDAVITPTIPAYTESSFYVYVIRTPQRDALKAKLLEANIESGIHYPLPLHMQPICQHLGYREGQFPVTEQYAKQILSLPMFAELTDEDVQRVAATVVASVRDLSLVK